jgi:hypothetical protein
MEQQILSDKNIFPTEEVIYSHIGKKKKLWESLFDYIHSNHPEISEQWRYYNDGKTWLLKVTKKTKTIFWLSLIKSTFRTTFYLTDKAVDLIKKSPISEELKEQFLNGKRFGKIHGVTITFKNKKNIDDAKALISIKLILK